MLSYTQDQAIELLDGKLAGAKQSLKNAVEDLEFLREQVRFSTLSDVPSDMLISSDC